MRCFKRFLRSSLAACLALMLSTEVPAHADNHRRVALLIGNYNYAGTPVTGEAELHALAASLRNVGFDRVIEKTDLTKDEMLGALKEFSDFAALSDSALVFYAGNGINLEGAPILLPIGARTDTVKHAADDGISFKKLLA